MGRRSRCSTLPCRATRALPLHRRRARPHRRRSGSVPVAVPAKQATWEDSHDLVHLNSLSPSTHSLRLPRVGDRELPAAGVVCVTALLLRLSPEETASPRSVGRHSPHTPHTSRRPQRTPHARRRASWLIRRLLRGSPPENTVPRLLLLLLHAPSGSGI